MNIVDAIIILRYLLLQDAIKFLEQARDKIENQNKFIPNEVIAEIVYVLGKVYKIKRVQISDNLTSLLNYSNIRTNDKKASRQVRFELTRSLFFYNVVKMWSNGGFYARNP